MVSRSIVPGTYAMFTARDGAPAELVVNLWKHIWALEKPDQLHRSYRTDYEVHYTAPDAPAVAHVDVYIGIRDKQ
jgi:predicted transcriptional regulator YdeE